MSRIERIRTLLRENAQLDNLDAAQAHEVLYQVLAIAEEADPDPALRDISALSERLKLDNEEGKYPDKDFATAYIRGLDRAVSMIKHRQ